MALDVGIRTSPEGEVQMKFIRGRDVYQYTLTIVKARAVAERFRTAATGRRGVMFDHRRGLRIAPEAVAQILSTLDRVIERAELIVTPAEGSA